jgi:hypothetical protein
MRVLKCSDSLVCYPLFVALLAQRPLSPDESKTVTSSSSMASQSAGTGAYPLTGADAVVFAGVHALVLRMRWQSCL